jgi:hypothetical protein
VNADKDEIKKVINVCLKVGLFNKEIYRRYRIITSSYLQGNLLKILGRQEYDSLIKEEHRIGSLNIDSQINQKGIM